jgi:hypothetical protein
MTTRARIFSFAVIAAFVLVACRGVLGIDTLEYDDGGDAHDGSAPVDASGDENAAGDSNASGDSNTADTSSAQDAGDGGCNVAGTNCFKCCRDAFGATLFLLQEYAAQAGCICLADGGRCGTECGTSFCANPDTMPPGMSCGSCIDPAMTADNPACASAMSTCLGDPVCHAVGVCVQSCAGSAPP